MNRTIAPDKAIPKLLYTSSVSGELVNSIVTVSSVVPGLDKSMYVNCISYKHITILFHVYVCMHVP